MKYSARGAILVPTSLTWAEAMTLLGLLHYRSEKFYPDPALDTLRKKLRKVVETVEQQEQREV